jgi:hypothetical protein
MKKILSFLMLLLTIGSLSNLNAQCAVSNPTITNAVRISNGNGTCTLKFDLSFTMENNNGNKTIVIHLWSGNTYPNPAICYLGGGCGQPTAAQLSASYGSIVINNDPVSPSYFATYPFISGVTILTTDPAIIRTGGDNSNPFNFTLTGVTIASVPCAGGLIIRGDIWSTNAGSLNSNTNPQCATSNIYLGVGDPIVNGFKTCTDPRLLNFGVSTTSVSAITVTYKIYRSDGNGTFDPSTDVDVTLPGSDPITVSSATSPQGRSVGFIGNGTIGEGSDYWVVVTYTPPGANPYSVATLLPNGACASLPVDLKSFTATRDRSTVKLEWKTASENNNKGFEVQRYTGNGAWETIAFAATKAVNGNSDIELQYTYTDNNTVKGVSQYRIRQVDLDGKSSYSVTRLVYGEAQNSGIVVYPNPGTGGRINALFTGTGNLRNITIADASGRIVRQWKSVADNNVKAENLAPGFYTISVAEQETGTTIMQKFIIANN